MILQFPNLEALRLSLDAAWLPADLVQAPVEAARGANGQIWIRASHDLISNAELAPLGVRPVSEPADTAWSEYRCWAQLLPLQPLAEPTSAGCRAVLFRVRERKILEELVNELLRQGNDRVGLCSRIHEDEEYFYVRVSEPPYYSLLRALEDEAAAIHAYYECAPGLWIALAWGHPLADKLRLESGLWLLLDAPNRWQFVEPPAFVDLYEQADLTLDEQPISWETAGELPRIRVPLSLERGVTSTPVELWVVEGNATQQLEQFVKHVDEALLAQLSFAVATIDGRTIVVLKARAGRNAVTQLPLEAQEFCRHQKLGGLFLPEGYRLHPTLRRDVVARMFVPHDKSLTWLQPLNERQFIPQSISDTAFHPLSDWVDYVIDQEWQILQVWRQSHQFEFEDWVGDDLADEDDDTEGASLEKTPESSEKQSRSERKKSRLRKRSAQKASQLPSLENAEQSEVVAELREQEQSYLQLESPLDADERTQLWRRMAHLNTALDHRHDATICWANGLWEDAAADETYAAWLDSETNDPRDSVEIIPEQLTSWLEVDESHQYLHRVAAFLQVAVRQDDRSLWNGFDWSTLSRYLEKREPMLPVRVAWLAWTALAELSGRDELSLARARDRILENLFERGLRPDRDLPTFLRTAEGTQADRYRALRESLLELHRLARKWVRESPGEEEAHSPAYVDLIFAFGLARAGETTASQRLLGDAEAVLMRDDHIHQWLCSAYRQRIEQALNDAQEQGTLDNVLLERLHSFEKLDRYKIDRLREHSQILEPHERINPYRRLSAQHDDELGRRLASLYDEINAEKLRSEIGKLWRKVAGDSNDATRVLTTALELAPRLGRANAEQLLQRVLPMVRRATLPREKAILLARGLQISAHFGITDHVSPMVTALERTLAGVVAEFLDSPKDHTSKDREESVERLLEAALRGLRRLGLASEVAKIFGRMATVVRRHVKKSIRPRWQRRQTDPQQVSLRAHRLLLAVAAGWFYFGRVEEAGGIVQEVRQALLSGENPPDEQQRLAVRYATAAGQAPFSYAISCLKELFDHDSDDERRLPGIEATFTTSSHFSLPQLDLVEAAVLSLVGDDSALNAERRRWMDEDEFLVRRRIHRDLQQLSKSK